LLLLCATTTPGAQSAPGLAGTWTLATGSDPSWGLGREFVAIQDGKTLAIVRKPSGAKATYLMDGSESVNTISITGENVEVRSKVKWDGAKLVLTATYRTQKFDCAVTQTWKLEPSGELAVDLDYVQGPDRTSSKSIYKKS